MFEFQRLHICNAKIILTSSYNSVRPGQDVKQYIETVDAVWQGILFIHSL